MPERWPWFPDDLVKCKAIANLIESVADEQEAIADLLEAEKCKIETVAKIDGVTVDQLIAIDKSVQSLTESLTMLAIVIRSKLKLFEGCLCDECEEDD